MATITKQPSSITAPAAVTYSAVTASDDFVNGGNERLHVKNGAGAPINVTVVSPKLCDQGVQHNLVIAVPNASDRFIGPFDPTRFNDPVTGKTTVTYSSITTITAALVD